ncbi:MAG: DNA mismatch repair protein MutS [Phycisphaerales bacterium]
MSGNRDTPAMRQYAAFKARHPDCVLFFRMGDFYEMFDDDARLVHRLLGLTLTERSAGIPMAGLPYHQLDTYLRRMVDAGHRVAVCDQVQDPREAKGVVERAVTRVITPGTLVEDSLLDDASANHLAAVAFTGDGPDDPVGVAIVEISTGAFVILDRPQRELADELLRRDVHELLYCDVGAGEPPERVTRLIQALAKPATPRPAWHFRRDEALGALREQFRVRTLAGFGIDDEHDPAVPAAGVVLRYLRETQALDDEHGATSEGFSSGTAGARVARRRSLMHVSPPRREESTGAMRIDGAALRALEIERTIRSGDADGSLLGIFAGTGRGGARTPMGKRLLRDWLRAPLCERDAINARLDMVEVLHDDTALAKAVGEALGEVQDVARIVARIALGRATPRDLVALGGSLRALEPLRSALDTCTPFEAVRRELDACREALTPIAKEIERCCVESPPPHLREGGLIRDGVDLELDEARGLQRDAGAWLAEYQARLTQEHELPSLKVGYNKVFGYYIELPSAQARRAPDVFTRKQTLKNAERYITPELKEYEDKVLRAGERAVSREVALFVELCERVAGAIGEARTYAHAIARLDACLAFADKARRRSWIRPEIVDEPVLDIAEGRHPVLDELLGERFVPNDCTLGTDDAAPLALITGPNMAGKSTYIRQVALLTLLAHAGSFVPAQKATIGLTDRLCTRIGADDALHAGQSTFMVEMVETASILHHASERTLVVLDEIGRGTSTLDGLSLAWAIVEHLSGGGGGTEGRRGPRTLFATHYHELTQLDERLPGRVRNLHVAVREVGDDVVFLHRILPGHADRSYGIHVARLAGLPAQVVARAHDVMGSLSVAEAGIDGANVPAPAPTGNGQLGLFTEFLPHPVIEELKALDLNRMSPMDAFETLRKVTGSLSE